jgi:hypothetical protein
MRGALRRTTAAAAAAGATAATCRRALSDAASGAGGSGSKRLQDVVLTGSAPPVSVMGPGKGGASGAVAYKGATFDKRTGKWRASITVNKKKIELGVFGDAKSASDAYVAAKAVYAGQQYGRGGGRGGRDGSAAAKAEADGAASAASAASATAGTAAAAPGAGSGPGRGAAASAAAAEPAAVDVEEVQVPAMVIDLDTESGSDADASTASTSSPPPLPSGPLPRVASAKYTGVIQEGEGAALWEAVVVANGREISGGEYESEEDAARAYDALARMYLGPDAATNFPADVYTSWLPPEAVAHTGQIETKPGVPLTVDEVVDALKQERGGDVKAIDIRGKSDLAEWLVFVTGSSAAHMRRMADMVSRAVSCGGWGVVAGAGGRSVCGSACACSQLMRPAIVAPASTPPDAPAAAQAPPARHRPHRRGARDG